MDGGREGERKGGDGAKEGENVWNKAKGGGMYGGIGREGDGEREGGGREGEWREREKGEGCMYGGGSERGNGEDGRE